MTSPSKPSRPTPHILTLLPLYASNTASHTTATLTHLSTLLSHTKTLDTTLLTTTYTLHLLHALLAHNPPTASLPLTKTLTPLTTLLSEYRILLRLTGLLPIYLWAAKTYVQPPKDMVLRGITWAQIGACAVFQVLENGAFLAGRGVVGWEGGRVERAWRWSGRAWMAYVGMEFLRLGWEWREFEREDVERGRRVGELRGREEGEKGKLDEGREENGGVGRGELELRGEKVGDVEREVEVRGTELMREREVAQEKWKKWTRELGVNAAYAPITIHYSLENGPLGEGSLGALGMVVGWLTFGKAWKDSA